MRFAGMMSTRAAMFVYASGLTNLVKLMALGRIKTAMALGRILLAQLNQAELAREVAPVGSALERHFV